MTFNSLNTLLWPIIWTLFNTVVLGVGLNLLKKRKYKKYVIYLVISVSGLTLAYSLINIGMILEGKNKDEIAVIYYNHGRDNYLRGEYLRAANDFTLSIENGFDDNGDAYFARALSYKKLSYFELSLSDFKEARERNGHFSQSELFYFTGVCNNALERYQDAVDDYSKAISLNYEPLEDVYVNRAHTYYALSNYDGAINDATEAINLNNKYYYAYYVRGNAHVGMENYYDAITDYNTAIKSGRSSSSIDNNTYAELFFRRGVAYFNIGPDYNSYKYAEQDFTQYLDMIYSETPPLNKETYISDTYYARGMAYLYFGINDKAIEDLDKYLRISNPEDMKRAYAGEIIKKLNAQ